MSKYFTDTLPLNKFSKELQSGTAAPTLFPFSFQQYFFPDYSIFKLSPTWFISRYFVFSTWLYAAWHHTC
ncbi:hypothetical protein PAHAL_8G077400 [Panicum hallii]|uniref:Uncharacterized protein n=1 Tax=Panicum hallii TaxID=206008 RepID=A0A2T8I850_9POAL|nr:hypothetical protein PAHAL_8G077400 [Panicum hallii]